MTMKGAAMNAVVFLEMGVIHCEENKRVLAEIPVMGQFDSGGR